MKLTLDEDQLELQRTVRRLVTERSGPETVRKFMDSDLGYDAAFWSQLAEMGLLELTVPEELGGAGAGNVERSIVQEELGRGVVPSPFLASAVLATDTLLAIGDSDAHSRYLPSMADGSLIATIAVAENDSAWPAAGGATTATVDGDSWRLTGHKTRVVHGDSAGLFLVYVSSVDGPAWFAVERDAAGVTIRRQSSLDLTRRFASVDFDNVAATRLDAQDAVGVLEHVRDLAAVAIAAEQVGGHERLLTLTTEYAKDRMQFGRPIGSYQAVKHGLADVYCAWELALSVMRYAAWAADEALDELPAAAATAQLFVGQAYFDAARAAVQYHGGIGFTWEHDAHLYFKRAKSSQLMLGSTVEHRLRLADRLAV